MKRRVLDADIYALISLLISAWRRYRKESGPPDALQTREFRSVVNAVKTLKQGLEVDGSLIGKDYFSDPELLGAYLLYHWVIHYQQGLTLLGELPLMPKRVLDICSGPAAFAFAALRHGATEVIATDQNAQALQLGGEICGRYGMPLTVRQWHCLKKPMPIEGKFDLIMLGHCLGELFPMQQSGWRVKQRQFVDELLHKLTPQGFLLIVDSSFLESNKRVLDLREELVKDGISVQAPCVWRGECPALKGKDSPCYAQRELEKPYLIKEIQRGAQINLGSLKMSYMIFRSPTMNWPQLPQKSLYRVISPPFDSHQGKRYYLCGTDGKKNLGSHLTQHPVESRAFEYLRRGELISINSALERQHAFDIVQGTQINVEAACGKPLPEHEGGTV